MIQVLERAFDILEFLSRHPDGYAGSKEIAEEFGISEQCANNILRVLYQRGYLAQNRSRNYRLGSQCVYLGSFADHWSDLRRSVAGPVKNAAEKSGLLAFCGVLENDHLLSIAVADPSHKHAFYPAQSWWDELHSTACGRILLAFLSAPLRKKILNRSSRSKLTAVTVVDADELEDICRQVRIQGYALVDGESRDGVHSVAIPLYDAAGNVTAALALSGNTQTWEKTDLEQKLEWLSESAVLL